MGKQFTGGRFTANVSKVLKGAGRIFCQTTEGGDIFITDGNILFRMNQLEFDALARPVVCCDPGNWTLENGEKGDFSGNLESIFTSTARDLNEGSKLDRAGIAFSDGKLSMVPFHCAGIGFVTFFNQKFVDCIEGGASWRSNGSLNGAVVDFDGLAAAVVLPIRAKPENQRAALALFGAPGESETEPAANGQSADRRTSDASAEIAELRARIAELETERAENNAAAEQAIRAADDARKNIDAMQDENDNLRAEIGRLREEAARAAAEAETKRKDPPAPPEETISEAFADRLAALGFFGKRPRRNSRRRMIPRQIKLA